MLINNKFNIGDIVCLKSEALNFSIHRKEYNRYHVSGVLISAIHGGIQIMYELHGWRLGDSVMIKNMPEDNILEENKFRTFVGLDSLLEIK